MTDKNLAQHRTDWVQILAGGKGPKSKPGSEPLFPLLQPQPKVCSHLFWCPYLW